MSFLTSLTLDKLPKALEQQHNKLWKEIVDDKAVMGGCLREHEISEPSVHIAVLMLRKRGEIFLGTISCDGKCGLDSANITISPDNKKVTEVVSAHFKNWVVPSAMMMETAIPRFDTVTINDKKII